MSAIAKIHAREVLDSRGNPTIQVEVWTQLDAYGSAMVPSGASTGELEAVELRDGKKSEWYKGKGVSTAVKNVNEIISKKLCGIEVTAQKLIDKILIELDGTKNKSHLGANALLGTSLAILRAAADECQLPLYQYIGGVGACMLPVPMLNVINGGAHASNTLDFQEFMIMPLGAKTFKQSMQMANFVFHTLAEILKEANYGTLVGDEGGFAPDLKSHEEALDFLVKAIKKAGFNPAISGDKAVAIALDPASSEFYKNGIYTFKKLEAAIKAKKPGFEKMAIGKGITQFNSDEMVAYYEKLVKKYPIISIEDGLAESDWEGFIKFRKDLGNKIQIMGDDLTVTNPQILQKAIDKAAINSILIKLNQIGTVSETIEAIQMAHKANFTAVVSHRSGETEDTTIADLAVGLNTGQIKTGSMSRTDRIAKYNRLLAIEEELGSASCFKGQNTFHNLGEKQTN